MSSNAQADHDETFDMSSPTHRRAVLRHGFDELSQDIAFAARALRRNVGVTLLIVVILALGIGATTAVFSLYETVIISPVQTGDASRLVWIENARADASDHDVTTGAYFAWRDGSHTLSHLGTFANQSATLLSDDAPTRLEGAAIGDGFLSSLAVEALAGRTFTARDFESGAPPVVMLSASLWRSRFRSDSAVFGRPIMLDGVSRIVVGIMPTAADLFDDGIQFWLPSRLSEGGRNNFVTPRLQIVGLLKPGVTRAAAERELTTILAAADTRPTRASEPVTAHIMSLTDRVGGAFRSRLLLVFAAVACVLAVGCANVAGLLLARGVVRQRELAIRASLGASRGRLVRQLLTENALLTFVAGAFGLLVGNLFLLALKTMLPSGLPHLEMASINMHAILFAFGVTAGCCVVAGLVPAWRVAMVDVQSTLQSSARGTVGGGERLRRMLIVAEVCMATVLLITAGLLTRSASALDRVPLGFSAGDVLSTRISLPRDRYQQPASVIATNARLLSELRASMGQTPVAMVSRIPLVNLGISYDFAPADRVTEKEAGVNAAVVVASSDYFRTIGIALRAGRDFSDRDGRSSPRVAIVNLAMARRLGFGDRARFPVSSDGVGDVTSRATESTKQTTIANNALDAMVTALGNAFNDSANVATPWRIVGVIDDTRDWGSRNETRPQIYVPMAQTPDEVWDWVNRTSVVVAKDGANPATLTRLREAVHRVDASLPLYDVQLMSSRVRDANAIERAYSVLLIALGATALALAAAGIYAMLAYAVRQRLPEIGVRMALGASPSHIVQLIVRWVLGVTVTGVLLGLACALSFTRLLGTLLFGVGATDVVTLSVAAVLMLLTALATCVAPVRRALAVTPDSALRAEG